MAIPNQFLRRRSTIAFFSQEDVAFDYKYPAADAALVTVDPIDLNQALNFTDLTEVGTRLLNMQSVLNYGERTDASFQVISKIKDMPVTNLAAPVGQKAVDYRPAEHFLINQLMGDYVEYLNETGSGGTDNRLQIGNVANGTTECVGYSFKDTPNTFQISQLVNGHMLKCAMGSILSGGSLNISREGALTWELNSRSARIQYSGTAAIDATQTAILNSHAGTFPAPAETVVTLELKPQTGSNAIAADFIKPGDHFAIVDGSSTANQGNVLESGQVSADSNGVPLDQTGAGGHSILRVLSVSGTTITCDGYTVVNGFNDDSYLVPILPDPDLSNQPANVIPQGNAQIYLAPRDATLQVLFDDDNKFLASDFTMSIDKSLGDPGVGELNGEMYPAPTYVAQDYSVNGTMSMVLRPADLYRLNSSLRDYDKALGVAIKVPSVSLNGTDYRTIYIALRSVRISFEGSEQEGAEGASLSYVVTSGGQSITKDSELMSILFA